VEAACQYRLVGSSGAAGAAVMPARAETFREDPMDVVYEEGDADYEQYQMLLLQELVRSVRGRLEVAGVKGKRLQELVEGIAFDVGAIIDGSQLVSTDEDHLVPVLGFAEGRMRDQLLLSHGGGGSSLHEFVPGTINEEFGGARR
jgi:hypothetical protein